MTKHRGLLRADPRLWRSAERDECSAYCVRVKTPRPVAIGLFALSALLLSGCSPEAAVPSAPPAAEGEALFASDEEALAAAEAAFAEYLDSAFAVFGEDKASPNQLSSVATGQVLETDTQRAERYTTEGLRQAARPDVVETRLQQYIPNGGSPDEVVTYACLDGTTIELLDSSGISLSDPDRAKTITVENTFVESDDGGLLLSQSEIWAEGAECEF